MESNEYSTRIGFVVESSNQTDSNLCSVLFDWFRKKVHYKVDADTVFHLRWTNYEAIKHYYAISTMEVIETKLFLRFKTLPKNRFTWRHKINKNAYYTKSLVLIFLK